MMGFVHYNKVGIIAICCLFATCQTASVAPSDTTETSTSIPSNLNFWATGELLDYIQKDNRKFPDNPAATGTIGAVTTTYHSGASWIGLNMLKNGGNSIDAALSTALAQVTLNAGAVISFFGIMNMVHYDAENDKIWSMDATWNIPQDEDDPMSIPGIANAGSVETMFEPRPISGRTALVGGFMKGVESASQRFGKLPFEYLFGPSIYLAENGFEVSRPTAAFFAKRIEALQRLPETRETLLKENGQGYEAGDRLVQGQLAQTLRSIAKKGSDYMYSGPWGHKLITAIQKDGGKMNLDDLADYEVIWNEPLKAQYGQYEISTCGPPVIGSVNLIEALNLAYAADIPNLGHWSENGESLRRISDVTNAFALSFLTEPVRRMIYPTLDLNNSARITKETANKLWEEMEKGTKIAKYRDPTPRHSDTVVAIDQWGNMTAITHSINCVVWGNEAIVIDGVSIGDAASFQQRAMASLEPGQRLPSPIEVGILSKNGQPVIPFASMATGLHQQTVQSLLNIMVFDMDIQEAVDAPAIFLPSIDVSNPLQPRYTVRVMEGRFPRAVIDSSGLPVDEFPGTERRYMQGLWLGIHRDAETGRLKAVSPPYATGMALAY